MKILIVGRSGQLSQALQKELAKDGQVIVLGQSGLNLANPEQIRQQVRQLRPRLIVNAAAYTAVERAESAPREAFAINAVGPGILAEEAARLGAPLIHYSTDYVFDGRKATPYVETDTPNPLSVYGESKLAGERAIQAAGGMHLILRTSWVYSRHGHNFLLTMQRLLGERERLTVVDDEIGAPTWAGTLANVTGHLIRQWWAGGREPHGLYHLTATGETSWYGFACAIGAHLAREGRLKARIEPIASRDYPTVARRPLNSRLDCSRLQQDWGLVLPYWAHSLQQCLETSGHMAGPPLSRSA